MRLDYFVVLLFSLDGIVADVNDSAYFYTFSVAWSVHLSSVVCRHYNLCLVLKPVKRFKCHLADILVASTDTCGVSDP